MKNCLIKNSDLPPKGKVNVFGRIQFNYYKSSTGSGGLVIQIIYSLYDLLSASKTITINKDLANVYKDFIKENPFNHGNGTWASEPWSQEEMPLTEKIVKKHEVLVMSL